MNRPGPGLGSYQSGHLQGMLQLGRLLVAGGHCRTTLAPGPGSVWDGGAGWGWLESQKSFSLSCPSLKKLAGFLVETNFWPILLERFHFFKPTKSPQRTVAPCLPGGHGIPHLPGRPDGGGAEVPFGVLVDGGGFEVGTAGRSARDILEMCRVPWYSWVFYGGFDMF